MGIGWGSNARGKLASCQIVLINFARFAINIISVIWLFNSCSNARKLGLNRRISSGNEVELSRHWNEQGPMTRTTNRDSGEIRQ